MNFAMQSENFRNGGLQVTHSQLILNSGINTRSMGVKLIVICLLAVVMTIPSFFVDGLVSERTRRGAEVTKEISSHVGGPQTFLGPTLAIPYTVPARSPALAVARGIYLVFPAQASAVLTTTTTERHRSLFRVPVFQADLKLGSTFDLKGVPAAAPQGAEFDWSRAEILVGVSDARGALADSTLATEAKVVTLTPSELADNLAIGGDENTRSKMFLLGARPPDVIKPETSFHATSTLRFSGAERIAVLAYGKTTRVTARGDWPNPGFDGAALPVNQNISNRGFSAEWFVPYIARGVRAEGPSSAIAGLTATALGLSFIEVADAYQSVNRSLKYVLLILGLVFLSYFVFEVTTGKRVHPAQYVLVGVAQLIFYLLLLSISERTGFDWGFLLAAVATVVLLSANAGWIFASGLQAIRALLIFTVLYVLIYLLLRLEDNALLVGAISSFVAVAAVMYFTRGLDWYGTRLPADTAERPFMPESSKDAV
jgi:inner membrane protein